MMRQTLHQTNRQLRSKIPAMSYVSINSDALNTISQNIINYSPHPNQTQIIAVTKKFTYLSIINALQHNIVCIGENQVQEFEDKNTHLSDQKFESHLIGHLQSNKLNKALSLFDVIQTVDSFKLANKMNERLKCLNKEQSIYLQLNIGNDLNKHGFSKAEILTEAEKITTLPNLRLLGIMTILPYIKDAQDTQTLYAQTRQIQQKIKQSINPACSKLSMGMSRDYIYALKEGATHIRIGTALYGPRPTNL